MLETEVALLRKAKPGRKPRIIESELRKPGVCAITPEMDSAECPDANVYRHQQGCRGTACVQVNTNYYEEYRAKQSH